MAKVTIDGQAYDYDPNRMLNTEAIALQKVTGMKMQEWTTALTEGDAFALTGLVWLLWRRNGREVAFDEVEFDIGQLDLTADDEDEPDPTPPAEPDDEPSAA
jgi:hypothetical protein